jgi:alpha-L-arabinofuranosidase
MHDMNSVLIFSKVKYWALGNETWGPWQVEQMTKEAYAHKAYQWAKGKDVSG